VEVAAYDGIVKDVARVMSAEIGRDTDGLVDMAGERHIPAIEIGKRK